MTELIDIARSVRGNAAMLISSFPGGNMTLSGSGVRFHHLPRHEKDDFLTARCRH